MIKKLFLYISILLLYSCQQPPPSPSIPDHQLIPLLFDLQVAEAALQPVHKLQKDSMMQIYYQQAYERNGVTEAQFLETIDALRQNPKKSHEIYKKVIEFQKRKEKEAKKEKE